MVEENSSQDALPILDPHIHLWDQKGTPRKPTPLAKLLGWNREAMIWVSRRVFPKDLIGYFGKPDYVVTDYLPGHYLRDAGDARHRFAGFVHVQAGWEEKGELGPVGETRWLESLGAPELLGVVGHADLLLGDGVAKVLEAHMEASPRFRGVRYMLSHSADPDLHSFEPIGRVSQDARWREGFAQLGKRGLSFDAWCYSDQLPEVIELAERFEDTAIVLCHAGTPVGLGGPFGRAGRSEAARASIRRSWERDMERLARHPKVYVKLSGLTMPCLGWGYHELPAGPAKERLVRDLGPLYRYVIDLFGVERCMFASNFPVDKVSTSWAVLYDAFKEIVKDRPIEEQERLFYGTAAEAYRVEASPAPAGVDRRK